jgi:hypothetical protein
VEPEDIEATADRVDEAIERRLRVRPDGTTIRWRSVAVDRAWSQPWRCAFMAWDDPDTHPARAPALHPNGATGFARLDVVTPDMTAALQWLGGRIPPGVLLREGSEPGVTGLSLSSPGGDIAIV